MLKPLIKKYHPKSILTDNNPFREEWNNLLKESKVISLHAHPYYPQDKGKVERAIRNVAEEFIYLLKRFPAWLNGKIEKYRVWHNKKRFHLGVNEFIVKIGKPCSGIDSMLLFTSLYALIIALDHKVLNKKTALLLFPIGLIGIFAFNIIRVYLLMLIGIHVSEDFAIGLFHQNVGWILFIIYFAIFYSLVRKKIYKNDK